MTKYISITVTVVCLMLSYSTKSVAQKAKDISTAVPICELRSYMIKNMEGHGVEELQRFKLNCFTPGFKESNSYWMKWEVESEGTMTFIVSSLNEKDDLDFVVFRDIGIDKPNLIPVRCMASGLSSTDANEIQNRVKSKACTGATGLSITSVDQFEQSGCIYNDDNFLKFIKGHSGDKYYLLINNYSNTDGFNISFDGNCKLKPSENCLEKIEQSTELVNLYPNPATNKLNLEYKLNENSEVTIALLDFSGRLIQSKKTKALFGDNLSVIDISQLTAGSYIVSLQKGESSIYKHFIKL